MPFKCVKQIVHSIYHVLKGLPQCITRSWFQIIIVGFLNDLYHIMLQKMQQKQSVIKIITYNTLKF